MTIQAKRKRDFQVRRLFWSHVRWRVAWASKVVVEREGFTFVFGRTNSKDLNQREMEAFESILVWKDYSLLLKVFLPVDYFSIGT